MDSSFLFGQFLGGLTAAMFLFLIASGLSLIFGILRILNFAHGSFYMIGAYLAWQLVHILGPASGSFWFAVFASALTVALLGALIERFLLRSLYGREELYQLLFTYAVVLVLADAAKMIWGTQQLSVSRPASLAGSLTLFGAVIPHYNLLIILLGPVLAFTIWLVLHRTHMGRMVRAAALDREMLGALGGNVGRIYTLRLRRRIVSCRSGGGACDADQDGGSRHGCRDHRRGLYRDRDRRPRFALGHLYRRADLWAVSFLRHSDFPALLDLRGLCADGHHPDHPAVGTVGEAVAAMTDRLIGRVPWTLLAFAAALCIPLLASRFYTSLATDILILALFATSLNLLLGTTGLVSFGHAAYFAAGAYTCAILMKNHGAPFALGFAASGVVAGAIALAFGFFCVRLTKIYFAMLTLAFAQIVWAICFKWNDVTGGEQGLSNVPYPDLAWMAGIPGLGSMRVGEHYFYVTLVLVASAF